MLLTAGVAAHDRITTQVTWARDIAPLVQARCVRCHHEGGRGPMPLTTYEQARPWAKAIKEEVLARRMPKWHAARGYGSFVNDPSLSPFEIALLVAWIDGGAPRGAAASAVPGIAQPEMGEPSGRTQTVPCNNLPALSGRLVAVRPRLDPGDSVGISVRHPDGRQDVVAWIRNFEPDFEETYWLRAPIELKRGTRLIAQAGGRCTLTLWIDDASSRRSPPERPSPR